PPAANRVLRQNAIHGSGTIPGHDRCALGRHGSPWDHVARGRPRVAVGGAEPRRALAKKPPWPAASMLAGLVYAVRRWSKFSTPPSRSRRSTGPLLFAGSAGPMISRLSSP